jgi:hypothetical protein
MYTDTTSVSKAGAALPVCARLAALEPDANRPTAVCPIEIIAVEMQQKIIAPARLRNGIFRTNWRHIRDPSTGM